MSRDKSAGVSAERLKDVKQQTLQATVWTGTSLDFLYLNSHNFILFLNSPWSIMGWVWWAWVAALRRLVLKTSKCIIESAVTTISLSQVKHWYFFLSMTVWRLVLKILALYTTRKRKPHSCCCCLHKSFYAFLWSTSVHTLLQGWKCSVRPETLQID